MQIPCPGYKDLHEWYFSTSPKAFPTIYTSVDDASSTTASLVPDLPSFLPFQGLYICWLLHWRPLPQVYQCFSPQYSVFCSSVTFSSAHQLPPCSQKWHFPSHLYNFPPFNFLHDVHYYLKFLFKTPEVLIVTDTVSVPSYYLNEIPPHTRQNGYHQ